MRKYSKRTIYERLCWRIMWNLTVRPFPHAKAKKWEIFLLRLFGAQIGKNCDIYSSADILIPRNLILGDGVCIAHNTVLQNSALLTIKDRAIISQGTYICCGSHDITKRDFPNVRKPIVIGEDAWIAAQCFVGPGVTIGDGAVCGARSVVFKDVAPWTVVGGNPAKYIKDRIMKDDNTLKTSEMGGGKY